MIKLESGRKRSRDGGRGHGSTVAPSYESSRLPVADKGCVVTVSGSATTSGSPVISPEAADLCPDSMFLKQQARWAAEMLNTIATCVHKPSAPFRDGEFLVVVCTKCKLVISATEAP